ncbi:hypothetical protein [Mycobacteroides abscessus]|uniref:hypothetical protein n=1 Tax=Mycobacteroides abscessus TaxID=36809 RepID=UPI0012FFF6B7
MNKDGWEPCPRCGGNKVIQRGPVQKAFMMACGGGVLFIIGLLTIPFLIGIPLVIVAPFMVLFSFIQFFTNKTNTCKDCEHSWEVKKKKKLKKTKNKNEEYKGFIR